MKYRIVRIEKVSGAISYQAQYEDEEDGKFYPFLDNIDNMPLVCRTVQEAEYRIKVEKDLNEKVRLNQIKSISIIKEL